jgi:hypothetical protein
MADEEQNIDLHQAHFTQLLNRNLDQRQRLANESVQKLYSRKNMEQGFLECFELIGGVPRLAIWANEPENYTEFLKLLTKFAPKDVKEELSRNITYQSNVPPSTLNRALEAEDGELVDDPE